MANEGSAILALADGRIFRGLSIGASGTTVGEVVFTTGLSGYQEVLSDPSYSYQIVTMTCAEIGNVGINEEDFESGRIQAAGLIVRSSRPVTSNWRAEKSLRESLKEQGIVAIEGVDTRALVLHIRDQGAQMGVISDEIQDVNALITMAKSAESMAGRDLAKVVTCETPYAFDDAPSDLQSLRDVTAVARRRKVVVYDFGVKKAFCGVWSKWVPMSMWFRHKPRLKKFWRSTRMGSCFRMGLAILSPAPMRLKRLAP